MNADEKRRFIRDLIKNVEDEILAKVAAMPDEWDGYELRQYVTEAFEHRGLWDRVSPRRRRAYNNEVIVRNL